MSAHSDLNADFLRNHALTHSFKAFRKEKRELWIIIHILVGVLCGSVFFNLFLINKFFGSE